MGLPTSQIQFENPFERLKRQQEIMRGFQNLTEVSKNLEHQLMFGLLPTICQDRLDDLEDLHHFEESILNESDNESENSDDLIGLDELASLISKGYEDIRASNPDIWYHEKQIDEVITKVIKRESFRAFEELMSPFVGLQGVDIQIEALLLAAKFVPFVPKIVSNIQNWVTTNLNLSILNLENYTAKPTTVNDFAKANKCQSDKPLFRPNEIHSSSSIHSIGMRYALINHQFYVSAGIWSRESTRDVPKSNLNDSG